MGREYYSADDDFTIAGHWARPGGRHRVAGTLERSETSLRLKLLGAFDDGYGESPFQWELPEMEPAVIHGESSEGTPITLLKSFYKNVNWEGGILEQPPVKARNSTVVSNAMLLGLHLQTPDDPCFTSCSLTFPNLDRWLDDRPFDFSMSPGLDSMEIRYRRPPCRTFVIGDPFGTLSFRPTVTPPALPWDDVTIRNRTYLHIETRSPKCFSWFVDAIGHAQRMFTLLFGRVVQATQVRLMVNANRTGSDSAFLYLPRVRQERVEMNPSDFVCRYPDISAWFRNLLELWFSQSAEIRHALDLVFSSLERPAPFLETKFLPFAQAVEVYSRAALPGRHVEKQDYKPIRKALIKSIPEGTPGNLKQAIVRNLNYANEWSLRERFSALLDTFEPETLELFCRDRSDFVSGIVDTRNHLTHYSGLSRKILKQTELYWATIKLQLMMRIVLLTRLGIPEAAVRNFFRRHHETRERRQTWLRISEVGASARGEDDAG